MAGDAGLLAWDECSGLPDAVGSVHAFDLAHGSIAATIAQPGRLAAVSGRDVYWSDDFGLHKTDFDTMETTSVVLNASPPNQMNGSPSDFSMSGDILVWDHGLMGPIEGEHVSTGETFTVSTEEWAYQAQVAGDWIVYTVLSAQGTGDIYGYQISTGQTYTLCNEPHDQRNPQIGDNGIVVWQDTRNCVLSDHDNDDLYGCSVWDRKVFPVATDAKCQSSPQVVGSVVSFTDDSVPGGYRMVAHDLMAGSIFGMCSPTYVDPSTQFFSLGDGSVAWTKGYSGIYVGYPSQIGQVAGADPYTVAVSASRSAYPTGAPHAVIASGQNWSDSLAGAGLIATDSPLLLTEVGTLPACTATELKRLKATSVDILGGTGSISADVQAQIAAILAGNAASLPAERAAASSVPAKGVRRIAGRDRYATAALVARAVAARPGFAGTVLIASGTGFADGLGASPLASHAGLPMLLSSARGLTAGELTALRAMKPKRVVIVGGIASVPLTAVQQAAYVVGATHVSRVWGSNRYSTAAAVAAFGVKYYGLTWGKTGIASSSAFAQAIVGGVLKGKQGSVLLLTSGTALSPSTAYTLRYKRLALRRADYIGGMTTISRTVRNQVRAILR